MNDETKESFFEQTAAFQKIWMDSMSKVTQAAFTTSVDSVPPEILKQIRNGIFEALAKSWDQFMRSPQFMEAVKQMMDNAIAFKKVTKDLLTKAHHEMEATSRGDIDSILIAVRHLESRVLDRMDTLDNRLTKLKGNLNGSKKDSKRSAPPTTKAKVRKKTNRT